MSAHTPNGLRRRRWVLASTVLTMAIAVSGCSEVISGNPQAEPGKPGGPGGRPVIKLGDLNR